MKKFIFKIGLYILLIFIGLEVFVRVIHLHKERPNRYLDKYNVEKWVPNQEGIWVIGNRRMHSKDYKINSFGYNTIYENNTPIGNEKEIALVGDSFIQGFHQDIDDSLGQKLERLLNNDYKILEFGYAGYDFADQLHMIKAYEHLFNKIEHVVVYMRYTDDLERDTYTISKRFSLNTPLNRFLKRIKTIVYLRDIGLMDPITRTVNGIKNLIKEGSFAKKEIVKDIKKEDLLKLNNFKEIVKKYGYDKDKNILLIDYSLCSTQFITYLEQNNFRTLDFNKVFETSKFPPTYIYDQHWNNHGRNLIAEMLSNHFETQIK